MADREMLEVRFHHPVKELRSVLTAISNMTGDYPRLIGDHMHHELCDLTIKVKDLEPDKLLNRFFQSNWSDGMIQNLMSGPTPLSEGDASDEVWASISKEVEYWRGQVYNQKITHPTPEVEMICEAFESRKDA